MFFVDDSAIAAVLFGLFAGCNFLREDLKDLRRFVATD